VAEAKDLVQIIRDNPGCVAVIDNDSWTLRKDTSPPADYDKWTWQEQDKWEQSQELASSEDKLKPLGMESYQDGACYGGDILVALAIIVGIKVESV
jgi:hypothetical protein